MSTYHIADVAQAEQLFEDLVCREPLTRQEAVEQCTARHLLATLFLAAGNLERARSVCENPCLPLRERLRATDWRYNDSMQPPFCIMKYCTRSPIDVRNIRIYRQMPRRNLAQTTDKRHLIVASHERAPVRVWTHF